MQLVKSRSASTAPAASDRVKFEVATVSPEIAQAWLDRNTGNRRKSSRYIDAYARDMAAGKWLLTGEAIKFDTQGVLLDGQHRLEACVKAGKGFDCLVIYGLPPSARVAMDTGKGRTVGDFLQLNGVAYATLVGATARLLISYKMSGGNRVHKRITNAEIAACLSKHKGIYASCAAAHKSKVLTPSHVAFVHYVASHILDMRDRADEFISVFATGVPDYDGCPAHALRERLIRSKNSVDAIKRPEMFKAALHAWNLFAERKKMTSVRWPKEVEIVGLDAKKI